MLFESSQAASTAMERVATGSKINSVQDDVAGSAMADRMTSQVRGLNMAVKNVNDAMAMLSVADNAAGDITDMLQRMRELAIQAASDTNSAADRQYLQGEVNSLIQEIDRVATQTQYNGMNLLDGSKNASFQVGANSGQAVGFDFDRLAFTEQSAPLSLGSLSMVDTGNTVGQVTSGAKDKMYGESETFVADFVVDAGIIQNLKIGDKVEFESHPGKHWTVSQNGWQLQDIRVSFYVLGDASGVSGRIFKVTPNPSDSSSNVQEPSTSALQRDIRISAQGVGRYDYPRSIQLSPDGNILVTGNPLAQSEVGYVSVYKWDDETWQQLGTNITQNFSFGRFGNKVAIDGSGNRIAVASSEGRGSYVEVLEWSGSDWIQVGSRFWAGNYSSFGDTVSLSHDGNTLAVGDPTNAFGNNADGEVKVFDWSGAEWVQRGDAVAGWNYRPNDPNYRPRFGRDVSVSADGNTFTASAASSVLGGIGDGYVKTFSWDGSSWTETPNALIGKDRIDFGRSVEIAANGESILVFAPSADAWGQGSFEGRTLSGAGQAYVFDNVDGNWVQRGDGFSGGVGGSAAYRHGTYQAHDAAISQSGTRAAIFTRANDFSGSKSHVSIFDWDGQSWVESAHLELAASNLNTLGAFDLSANGLVLSVTSGNDILTFDLPSQPAQSSQGADLANAGVFLTSIDEKMKTVAEQRAEYGAMQNRLQYTISNLMNVSEQTTIARSRIEDADFATESAALAKAQVLQQSGAAMLAQANARPQLVLQLVK